ncbi:MAG: arylamine N-acetyltransferase [Candidatus Promineifilaceae bacterium]|jgi:hypothetical protein
MAEGNKAVKALAGPLLGLSAMGLLMLPGGLRLCKLGYRRRSLDEASLHDVSLHDVSLHGAPYHGVVNLKDAVEACRRSGLQGWDLVLFAQRLVTEKFATYSTLNLWDPPGRAFIFGTGYCTQYNLALKRILDRLGFETGAVFALKVRFFDNEDWTMGHTWLRVTVDGETKDVCAGRAEHEPGKVNFVPLSAVHRGWGPIMFLTHLGMIPFMGFLEWKALLTGTESPAWAYKERA